MTFEFATAGRILFGPGKIKESAAVASTLGKRALFVTGNNPDRAQSCADYVSANGVATRIFSVSGEPTIQAVEGGVAAAREFNADLIVGFGGGSAIDAAKAIAALATNPGQPLDYLEVIGKGQPLTEKPLPSITIPTTAGTGAEVTKNAVLASPEHRVKVSLRHPLMLPDVALVDPELTYSMPPSITASTGLDALTQLIEPFTCCRANPVTDGLCREGIVRGARSLRRAFENGADASAREDMALASLFGGLALANSGLGAVHGFAGPIGGMFPAPHGAVCAALLPHVMRANVAALTDSGKNDAVLDRYREIASLLTADPTAQIDAGIQWISQLCRDLSIPTLSSYGITPTDIPAIVEKSAVASSMKANPIQLPGNDLERILETAL
jgi:alcohol dehydrogenase class IV